MSSHFCQNISIPCTAGNLEGRLTYREENSDRPGVILCSPHPLLAGNMDNNVITALADTLANHFPVLSFNYRGVGKSFKAEPDLPLFEYWDRLDQSSDFSAIISDTKQVIQWSKRFFSKFHLLGYSFGSFIGLSALPLSTLSFIGITPPLSEHNFGRLPELQCQTLLIFAEQENLLEQQTTDLPPKATIHNISNSDHFFLGKEHNVTRIVDSFLIAL
jgi:alpha/beta superfamily hydrolase